MSTTLEQERARIEALTVEFLANGGKIKVLPSCMRTDQLLKLQEDQEDEEIEEEDGSS